MRTKILIAVSALVAGCVDATDASEDHLGGPGGDGDGSGECGKIEGNDIGREGAELQLGGSTVTFHDWVGKTGEHGEYVGFSITLDGTTSVTYVVKAGAQDYPDSVTTWMHPAGESGPTAMGISNVEVCDDGEQPPPEDPCDNPDGCDDPAPDDEPSPEDDCLGPNPDLEVCNILT